MPYNQGTGSIQVGPGGVRRLDPRQLKQQAAGMRAQDEIAAQGRGPAMANALRMSQAELGGVQGRGAAAEGPSGWNALGTLLEQRKGNKQLAGMEEKAAALRGEVSAGREAGLQRESDIAERDFDYKRTSAEEKLNRADELSEVQYGQDQAARKEEFDYRTKQEEQRTARETAANAASNARLDKERESLLMEDPDGNQHYVQIDYQENATANGQPIPKFSDWTPVQKTGKGGSGSSSGTFGKLPSSRVKEIEEMADEYRLSSQVYDDFDPAFAGKTGITFADEATAWVKGMAPGLMDKKDANYEKWWRDYEKNHQLVALHGLFGSALTPTETVRWKKANINKGMSGIQIADALAVQREIIDGKIKTKRDSTSAAWPESQKWLDTVIPARGKKTGEAKGYTGRSIADIEAELAALPKEDEGFQYGR
tara:strand:+ start:12667 stop:13941 length:1275 start_codon:yes stop_codon:yes gene_type:complete